MIKLVSVVPESDNGITVNPVEFNSGFYYMYSSKSGASVPIPVEAIANNRDTDSVIRTKYRADPNQLIGLVYKDNVDTIIISLLPSISIPDDAGDVEFILDSSNVSVLDKLKKYFPDIAKQCDTILAKRVVLMEANPMDSLASLEVQVDLLTMILFDLIEKQPVDEQPSWFVNVKETFSKVSTLSLKPMDKLLQEVVKQKTFIRNLQKDYFEVKHS